MWVRIMACNLATFTITVSVPGDARVLPESKKQIEHILEQVAAIPGVRVDHRPGSMLIMTNPAG